MAVSELTSLRAGTYTRTQKNLLGAVLGDAAKHLPLLATRLFVNIELYAFKSQEVLTQLHS